MAENPTEPSASPTEPEPHPFDPSRHLINLPKRMRGDDGGWKTVEAPYLEVKYRILWLRTAHPDAAIETELVSHTGDQAVFRARVAIPEGGSATGWGQETAADFGDFLEKAECVPINSEILTRDGFKHFYQLQDGEDVLAYDVESDQTLWTPLRGKRTYPQAPQMLLQGRQFIAECTPDHTWAIRDRDGRRSLKQAADLRPDDNIVLAAPEPGGDHPLTSHDAAVLGWIMTDGTIRRRGGGLTVAIMQSKPETTLQIRELVGAAAHETVGRPTRRTFPSGRTYDCLPQHTFRLKTAEARRLFAVAGIESSNDLPRLVARLSHEARQAMLAAMMLADGDKRGYFGKKRKPGVMEAWQILATLEGFAVGAMKLSTAGEVPLQRLKKRRSVCVSELAKREWFPGAVWCPMTDYGTWVMRQGQRVMITGNTKALGRALAALGFGTQFCDDFDFEHASETQVTRVVDAPGTPRGQNGPQASQDRPQQPPAGSSGQTGTRAPQGHQGPPQGQGGGNQQAGGRQPTLLATEPQVKAIYAIARGTHAMDDEELDARCRERYGCSPQALTRRQASEFIDALKLGAAGSGGY